MDLDNLDLLEFVDCGFFVQNGAEPISINLQHTNIKKVVIRVGGRWLFYIKDRFIQIHCQGSLDSHDTYVYIQRLGQPLIIKSQAEYNIAIQQEPLIRRRILKITMASFEQFDIGYINFN